jgi:YD repeat-containing protein
MAVETRIGASPVSKTFGYDGMDRLTSVCFQAGSCPGGSDPFVRWSYDGVGNRLSEVRPSGTTSYSYDQMDRMLSAGATSYTYDRNGNQLSAGSRTFTYELANRLKTTTASGTTTTYTYDGDGKRLQASTGSQASAKTNFLWDVTGGLPELVLERNGNNALLRRYVNGQGRPVFMSTSASTSNYYHWDPLGSVRNVTNASGATQLTYDYDPYGAVRTQTGTLTNLVKFTGQYQDPTGLYHLRAPQ